MREMDPEVMFESGRCIDDELAALLPDNKARESLRARATHTTFSLRSSSVIISGVIFALFLVWVVGYVPADMDEFNQAHRLACLYPYSHLNTFLESCHAYLLDYGLFAYHRSFQHVGITSTILYFPFWLFWRSPFSYYLYGLLFLVVFSLSIAKAFELERKYALIPLCYFPLAYMFLHDTGPVRLGLLSFPVLLLLLRQLLNEPRLPRKMLYALTCALLLVLCVEDKAFYLLLLPSIAIFAAAWRVQLNPGGNLLRDAAKNCLPLAVLAIVFVGSMGLLLFVARTDGQTYFQYLNAALEKLPVNVIAKRITWFTISFPMYGERIFIIPFFLRVGFGVATVALAVWLVIAGIRTQSVRRGALLLFGLAYAIGVLVFLAIRAGYAGHHFIFLHIPALALLLLVAKTNVAHFRLILGIILVLNVSSMVILGVSSIHPRSARERTAVFRYLTQPAIAEANVINFSSWGGYYQQALFGDDSQLVTFSYLVGEYSSGPVELRQLGRLTGRRILNVCMNCDLQLMQTLFATTDVTEIRPGLRYWRIFQIEP